MSAVIAAIHEYASTQGSSAALISNGVILSYKELSNKLDELSETLSQHAGKCAGVELENGFNWVLLDLACVSAGIITIPLPDFFTDSQRQHALVSSGAALLFSDKLSNNTNCLFSMHGSAIACEELSPSIVKLPKETAKITYTSGTTGDPKGVCLSQGGMEQVAASLVDAIGKSAAKKTAAVLPLAVLLENIAGCYATLLAGGCYDVQPQSSIGFHHGMIPDFSQLAEYLHKSHARSCILVPELLRGLMQAMMVSDWRLPNMEFIAVGGSRVSVSLLQQAKKMGLPLYEGYGLSEAASVVSVNTPQQHKVGSVGQLLPHAEISIADDGEILLNDPALLGYVGEDTTTENFATGDLGVVDAEGFLCITGRKKNVIINSMGRNISPEWPESELLVQPQIAQAIVLGDARTELVALIVPVSSKIDSAQIDVAIKLVNKQLPEYAQIKSWQMVAPFSVANQQLTGTGRPRREVVAQVYSDIINTMHSAA